VAEDLGNKILSIKVFIADRPYPLKIKASEEANVRKAGKLLDEKVNQFKDAYAADKRDALAMAALMFAVDALKVEEGAVVDEGIKERLDAIHLLLDKALS
jgi:cell division protein ZapA